MMSRDFKNKFYRITSIGFFTSKVVGEFTALDNDNRESIVGIRFCLQLLSGEIVKQDFIFMGKEAMASLDP